MSTDHAKWADASQTWGARNPSRAEFTASLVPPGAHVLDIGAGSMVLKGFLPPDCTYTPSDIHDRGDGCIVADLNLGEFPLGRYDVITMIGVLEYLNDPGVALRRAGHAASRLIFTYNWFRPDSDDTRQQRAARGWLNHLTADELDDEAVRAGLVVTSRPAPCWYVAISDEGTAT